MPTPLDKLTAINVVVGQIISLTPHPIGDRISIATVEYGYGNQVSVIFGGIREVVRPGALVPFAPATKSCRIEGKKMRRRKFQGTYSYGELCSLYELGLVDNDTDQVAIFLDLPHIHTGEHITKTIQDLQNMDELWEVFKRPI